MDVFLLPFSFLYDKEIPLKKVFEVFSIRPFFIWYNFPETNVFKGEMTVISVNALLERYRFLTERPEFTRHEAYDEYVWFDGKPFLAFYYRLPSLQGEACILVPRRLPFDIDWDVSESDSTTVSSVTDMPEWFQNLYFKAKHCGKESEATQRRLRNVISDDQ
jgi:hypothetical protein